MLVSKRLPRLISAHVPREFRTSLQVTPRLGFEAVFREFLEMSFGGVFGGCLSGCFWGMFGDVFA